MLRSIHVDASAPLVAETLLTYRFAPTGALHGDSAACETVVEPVDAFTLIGRSRAGQHETSVVFFVQPADEQRAVIHGMVRGPLADRARLPVLLHHNAGLKQVRDGIERVGQRVLNLREPAAGPAGKYRELLSGLTYGIAA
jgi:hypothetical protein